MKNEKHGTEEEAICGRDYCKGILHYPEVKNCCCHINPPCGACVDNKLTCPDCGWEEDK